MTVKPRKLSSRAFARGFVGAFALRTVGAGMSLLATVVLARALGIAGFGIYSYALAVVSILSVPAQFGTGTVLMRFCASYENTGQLGRLKGLLRWANTVVLRSSLVFAAAAALVFALFPRMLPEGDHTAIWLALLLLPLVTLGDLRSSSLTGLHQYWKGQVPEMIVRPGGVLLIVGAVWLIRGGTGFTPTQTMTYYLCASLAAFCVGAWWLWRSLPAGVHEAEPDTEIPVWRRAGQVLTVTRGGGVILSRIDMIFLGALAGGAAAGEYRAASALSSLISFGLLAVNVVAAPNFSRLSAEADRPELIRTLALSTKLALACALPIIGIMIAFGRDIITVVYGKQFAGAYLPLVILAVGQFVNAATGPVGPLLAMTGQETWSMYAVVTAVVLSVPAYFVLVPPYGAVGAASASTLGLFVLYGILTARAWYWLRLTPPSEGTAIEADAHGG